MTEILTELKEPKFSPIRMIAGNLTARPLRAVLSILAISIQVILVLMIVGLTTGVVNEWGKRVEGVGADILVQSPNASIFFAFSSAVMQESFGQQIAALPGVDEVAPTLSLMDQKNFVVIYGIDYKRFNALSKGFLFGSGRPFESPDEALADDIVAQSRHLKVGDQITLMNHAFTICGIVAHGKGARFFIPLKTAQDISGAEKRVSVFYVRSKGDTEATRAEILKLDPNNRVRSIAEYMTLMNSSNLPELKPFIKTMVGIGIVISFLVVFLNMHTLVLERTREIGILKALGFTRAGIAQLLLGETLALTIIGSIVGIALTFLTKAVLTQTVPTLQISITNQWILGSILLATIGATAGALYPTLRAASYDPVVALAYE